MDILELTAKEQLSLLEKREISSVELVSATLERISSENPKLFAYITLSEKALDEAKHIDNLRVKREPIGKLAGLPAAIKDNIVTKDLRTTCASRMLANWIPPYDATVVERLKEAGAIVIGKTNLDEFAMGSSTEYSFFEPSRNPIDTDYVPGGSSGGSAVALASGMASLALGSDTGGSVRQPSAFCGLVGFKPTYGRISRYGLVAFSSSLDQISPFGKCVADAEMLYEIIKGPDDYDSTLSRNFDKNRKKEISDISQIRIGIIEEAFGDGLDPRIRKSIGKFLDDIPSKIEPVSLPATDFAVAVYYIISPAECSSNLARYDGVKYGYRSDKFDDLRGMFEATRGEGFGVEVRRRIMIGTFVLSAGYQDKYFIKAQKARRLIAREFEEAFSKFDLLITPTAPTFPFKFGEKTKDPLAMYLCDVYTVPSSLAGLPAISIPLRVEGEKFPCGLQIIAPYGEDEFLLSASKMIEDITFANK